MTVVDAIEGPRAERDTALALVLLGTDFHPFDRLVGWVDGWIAEDGDGSLRWLVQHGASPPPAVADGRAYLARDELDRLLGRSSIVVCHGGPGTIMEARRHGHVPIVVPRDAARGEHVDDHQRRFARRLARAGHVRLAEDREAFGSCVRDALSTPRRASACSPAAPPSIERFRVLADGLLEAPPRRWRRTRRREG